LQDLGRIINIRFGENEVTLSSPEKNVVNELSIIKEKMLKNNLTPNEALGVIQDSIDNRSYQAITNIKSNTYALWNKLVNNSTPNQIISIEIPAFTISRIQDDLDILQAVGYLRYQYKEVTKIIFICCTSKLFQLILKRF